MPNLRKRKKLLNFGGKKGGRPRSTVISTEPPTVEDLAITPDTEISPMNLFVQQGTSGQICGRSRSEIVPADVRGVEFYDDLAILPDTDFSAMNVFAQQGTTGQICGQSAHVIAPADLRVAELYDDLAILPDTDSSSMNVIAPPDLHDDPAKLPDRDLYYAYIFDYTNDNISSHDSYFLY